MKRIILVAFVLFLAGQSLAQMDFREGYIITLDGDTISGRVNYRSGSKNYRSCEFKRSGNEAIINYLPQEIAGYGFTNDSFFQAREISIKTNTEEVTLMKDSEIVFIEVLVNGIVSLCKYEDGYFVTKNNGEFQRLKNTKIETFVQGTKMLKNSNQHIGTLNILMFDCPKLRSRIQHAKLEEKSLSKLVEDYNLCMGDDPVVYKAKKPWLKTNMGVAAGVNISNLVFPGDVSYEHLAGSFEKSVSTLVGISFGLSSPRINDRLSLQFGLDFFSSKYYSYHIVEHTWMITRNYVTITANQLKVPLGVNYILKGNKVKPFFNLGVSTTAIISPTSNWVLEVEENDEVRTYEGEAIFFKSTQLGIWGGVGVLVSLHKKFDGVFDLRYDGINGFSDPIYYRSTISNFQLRIGIKTK